MGRTVGKMSALAVGRLKDPGMYGDGGGLYLQVTGSGAKSWIFRFKLNGREREMGLGPLHTIGLSEARDKAMECRKLKLAGIDPIDARRSERRQIELEAAKAVTFKECADKYIKAHRVSWRNEKHAAQWDSTLKTYAYPLIGALAVQAVDVGLVAKVLEAIWTTKTETATRLRQRIEAVLDWATSRGLRQGENPARWRGHLDNLFPAPSKVAKVRHHTALPYAEIAAFMVKLREQNGVSAAALEFAILTAGRTNEVLGARWTEIDLTAKQWTVPAERMKAAKEHRVPLSDAALAVLVHMDEVKRGDFVFPGGKVKKPLSNMALLQTLKRMERGDLTAHGFRSTFRDWVAEQTDFPSEVAEMALAHAVGDKVEAAYRRGNLFEKRRRLAEAWGSFCSSGKEGVPQED